MSMPNWDTRFMAVWDALVTVVRNSKIDNEVIFETENVHYGEKFPVDNFPACYVCPMPVDVKAVTFQRHDNIYNFELGIVVRNDNVREGYAYLMKVLGAVYDAIVADMKLTGTVDQCQPIRITPNWRNLGTGIEAFWGGLEIKLTKWGT